MSSDEEEDLIPDELAFNTMAQALQNESRSLNAGPSAEQTHIPGQQSNLDQPDPSMTANGNGGRPEQQHTDTSLMTNQATQLGPGLQASNNAIDWSNILNAAQTPTVPNLLMAPMRPVDSPGTADNFSNLGAHLQVKLCQTRV